MTGEVERFIVRLRAGPDAPVSVRMRLESILRTLEAELARRSVLDDWEAQFVDTSDAGTAVDFDRAFVSLSNVYDALGTPDSERHTHAGFGRAMIERGFAVEKPEGGRAVLRGCRLLRRKVGAPLVDPEPLVDAFLVECCNVDGGLRSRVRSPTLHAAYAEWARARDAEPLTIKRLSASLRFRGFEKLLSNGTYWLGIALRDGASSPSPRPSGTGERPSGVEYQAADCTRKGARHA